MCNVNKKILATYNDMSNLKKILKTITSLETTDEFHIDWENAELQFTLQRVMHNLENFDNYYKKLPETETKYYNAECEKCGWYASSQYCNGGGAIADTGDYSDPTCPICDAVI